MTAPQLERLTTHSQRLRLLAVDRAQGDQGVDH